MSGAAKSGSTGLDADQRVAGAPSQLERPARSADQRLEGLRRQDRRRNSGRSCDVCREVFSEKTPHSGRGAAVRGARVSRAERAESRHRAQRKRRGKQWTQQPHSGWRGHCRLDHRGPCRPKTNKQRPAPLGSALWARQSVRESARVQVSPSAQPLGAVPIWGCPAISVRVVRFL